MRALTQEDVVRFLENLYRDEDLLLTESSSYTVIGQTLCGFLNGRGGVLIIGVKGDRKIVDDKYDLSLLNKLKEYLVTKIVPSSPFTLGYQEYSYGEKSDKTVRLLVMQVAKGSKPPYLFEDIIYVRNRGYKRVDPANSKQIAELIKVRHETEVHWERKIAEGVDLIDLNQKLIKQVIKESKKNHRSNFNGTDTLEFLKHFGLFQNGGFTNACVVLFAKNPSKFVPQIRVRLTEYGESKTDKNLLRDEVLEGNIFEIRDDLERYVENLGIRSVFDKNQWKRIDFKFPSKALQEGVINALIHRDYSSVSSSVSISIYPDQIVISNSGGLPDGLKVNELKKSHHSHPVNPDIAHIVFLRGLIDKLGKGTISVVELCKDNGLKVPVWKETGNGVTLTFNGPKALRSISKISDDNANDTVIETVIDTGNDTVNDIGTNTQTDTANDTVNDTVTDTVISDIIGISGKKKLEIIQLIRVIKNNQGINAIELADIRGKSIASIKRYLKIARETGLIEFKGAAKIGGYYLTDKYRK